MLGAVVHEAHDWLGVDHARAGQGRGEGEALEQTNQEEKKMVVCQLLAEAVALTEGERNESFIFLEFSRLSIRVATFDVEGIRKNSKWQNLVNIFPILNICEHLSEVKLT